MSTRGDLLKAGIDSDGKVIDFFPSGVQLKKEGTVLGIVRIVDTEVDASAGGSAQTAAIGTVPAGAVLLGVNTLVTEAFDGDTTTTLVVGVAGATTEYIADSSADTLDAQASDAPMEYAAAAIPVIATWTNTANAEAGKVVVRLIYAEL